MAFLVDVTVLFLQFLYYIEVRRELGHELTGFTILTALTGKVKHFHNMNEET